MDLPTEILRSDEGEGTGSIGELFPMASPPEPVPCHVDWLDVLPPAADCLRDNQRAMLANAAESLREGIRRILLQAPTGFGKTHVIAAIVAAAIFAGLRVLILATRTRLVRQIHERLEQFDQPHGVIAAAMPGYSRWRASCQIASVDTLYRRCLVTRKMPLPIADVVIFDEAHLSLGASRQAVLDSYPAAIRFGVTATPAKTSGATLADQFDRLILGPSVQELIERKELVGPRIFAKPVITQAELNAVKTDRTTGDYATGALSKVMRRPKLVGDVVTNWLRIANGKRTLVFACDKGHGAELVTQFRQAGIAAEQLTDADSEETREEAISRLESGATLVLINCFLLSYGIDIPRVECVVLARPTRSVVLFLQAVGRGMRTYPGKEHMILIDHGRVIDNLGLPTYDRDWSISGENVNDQARAEYATDRLSVDERPRTCGECTRMWLVTEEGACCPECGWQPAPKIKPVEVTEAELAEIDAQLAAKSEADARLFFRQAIGWYQRRWPEKWMTKQNSGRFWAWAKTVEKFDRPKDERPPRWVWSEEAIHCSQENAGWLLGKVIAYSKAQEKQRKAQTNVRAEVSLDEAWSRSRALDRLDSGEPF